ncbi:hypothetical protein [Nocardiopsis metallicus]|uniref:Uncharacterized protein n=1 Tax=Nocardiopsis metallicus TaxID=179819 RepID=A0A840WHL5_9ACTN|nr:hypothetical protein [Nocardiopsis metallicus]MBB5491405.1 hypothetical protein [Nocardiopsis metallicus]
MSQSTLLVRAGDPGTSRASEWGICTRLEELAATSLVKEDNEKVVSIFTNSTKR